MGAMNMFRMAADLLHLASIVILMLRIYAEKNCRGISLKTQQLFLITFVTRYLDVFTNWRIPYNNVMKMLFLTFSGTTVYWIMKKYKKGYDAEHDTFKILFLIVPCLLLAVLTPKPAGMQWDIMENLWTFSIYIEAVAILPQLFLVRRTGEIENLTSNYIAAMGGYRGLYVVSWIYRGLTEDGYMSASGHIVAWVCGVVQTAIYIDFFYYYFRSKWYGSKFSLPPPTPKAAH